MKSKGHAIGMITGVVTHDAWLGGRIEYSNPSPLDRAHQLLPSIHHQSAFFFINTISSRPIQVFVAAPALFGSRVSHLPRGSVKWLFCLVSRQEA